MNRSLPLILTLDQHGVPHRWVTWQQAVWYYAKERVAWELGRQAFTIYGGRSHRTGERSKITANSIIAIRGYSASMPTGSRPMRWWAGGFPTSTSSALTARAVPAARW